MKNSALIHTTRGLVPLLFAALLLQACSTSTGSEHPQQAAQALPVLTVAASEATVFQEYTATLQGSKDIEIRPQVNGQLTHIYVDEGDFVRKGQALFRINDREYAEQLNNARASLAAAEANLAHAEIEVARLSPLVANKVISDIQLQSAQAARQAAAASVAQAKALLESARINLDYTLIKAPSDGYVGRIPFKTGSLASVGNPEPLTVLSEIQEVHVYFSMSESDFIRFKEEFPGSNIDEKIAQLPPVELLLADGSVYPQKGKVELVSGQFDESMGAISFRASFPNAERLLRSGNTGKIRIPRALDSAILVPQESTYEIQDKVFVFLVGKDNTVQSKPLAISGKSGNHYLVSAGLAPGDRIVYAGLDRLQDGATIQPQPFNPDSLKNTGPSLIQAQRAQ